MTSVSHSERRTSWGSSAIAWTTSFASRDEVAAVHPRLLGPPVAARIALAGLLHLDDLGAERCQELAARGSRLELRQLHDANTVERRAQHSSFQGSVPQRVPFRSHWGEMPLTRCPSFRLKIASFVFFSGSQPQIWLAAQLNPTSISSLRTSEMGLSPSPEQASCTRSGSAFVAVQRVASQVKPTSTPPCLLFLYSSHTFLQLTLLGGAGISGGFGDNNGHPDGPGASGKQLGGGGGNVPPGAYAADQTELSSSTDCCPV